MVDNDVAVNYDKAVKLCSNNDFLPRITEVKMSVIEI